MGILRYNDLHITNCHVESVYSWGIAAAYNAYWSCFTTKELLDDIMVKYEYSNVVISNNYIKDAGADSNAVNVSARTPDLAYPGTAPTAVSSEKR